MALLSRPNNQLQSWDSASVGLGVPRRITPWELHQTCPSLVAQSPLQLGRQPRYAFRMTTVRARSAWHSMHAMSRSSTFTRHGRGRHCQRCRPKNSERMSCVFKSIVSHSSWTAPPQTKLVSGLWQGVAILFVVSDQRALDLSLMSQTALHCLVCRGMVLQNNLTLTCH